MESCLLDLAKNEVQTLVNLVKSEAQYLCCFNKYVENFDQKKEILAAKHKDVKRKFQKGKGVFSFKSEAQQWEHEADDIIHIDTKIKKKLLFGWCPNCLWQYQRGKELGEKTQRIEKLLERCNSNIVAGRANISDIKYLSSQYFIHFESRESKFQYILKALQDENCNMIGLQGMGGSGKTSMAKEVGHKLKESKLIDRFIFLVVSQPPDFKKIRGELAKSLDLNLDEVKEEELSSTILSRITNMEEKLLIILDDVWVKFDLTEKLGIPFGHQHKGCNLLITTRSSLVSTKMGCQMIQLQTLTNEEALNLFEAHASLNNSYRGLKGMPQKIVKHCGGVPVAIVAVARALKNQPIAVWKDALKTLEDRGVDQNFEEAYKCLKLSYDNLKNQKAKELLLISSLFPEDFEIPMKFLIKIGTGLDSFNENDKYHLTRSEVHGAIMELMYSSLLLNGEEECVKMHDLVREVALWIGENNIQSLINLEKPIKGNLRYLFWKNDDFPDEFDGNKLEVLTISLDRSKDLIVSDTFFKEMTNLKVLILDNDERVPAPSLTNSLQPLKDIRTLILASLELGDISILGNLLSIRTLWFYNCSIIELPKEFLKLKKLRSLEVEICKIEKNNPFEVIEICSQIEELTFVGNECDDEDKDAISQNGSPLSLHRYYISSEDDFLDFFEKYGSMSRCFRTDKLSNLVSEATFKQLVGRAELLLLEGEDAQRLWKNLIPDIVPIDKEGVMNDLIVLHISSCPDMKCLIDTKDHDTGLTAFFNLAELDLFEMGVEDLCWGPLPSGFLEQLEIMKLMKCHNLKSILPNANYNLCHLKSMELEGCPMLTSVFQPCIARRLKQLEELTIRSCNALEYIIVGEDGDSNQKSYYELLFPKLKIFQIEKCNKLRVILSILFAKGLAFLEKISICQCEQLEYIFDKFQEGEDAMLPSLKELQLSGVPSFIGIFREYHKLMSSSMQKPSPSLSRHDSSNINQRLATRAFSWVQACCSLNKLRPTSKETNITISEHRSLDQTNPLGLIASKKWIDTAPTVVRQLVLHFCHIRKMELAYLHLNPASALFTLSMASMISWEELTITNYDGLKHLVTSEEDDYKDQIKCSSIFPKLQKLEIRGCKDLEFLFLFSISIEIKNLKSLTIQNAPKVTYVIGKYQHHHCVSNQDQNEELHFDLPALEVLCFEDVPQFINIGPMNFKMVSSSLQNVCSDEGQLNSNITKEENASTNGAPLFHVAQNLLIQLVKNIRKMELVKCANLISVSTLSIASTILLEDLTIKACDHLKYIVADEGDDGTHMNYNSIFPKLKLLEVSECDALEYLFPTYAFRCPAYLESLRIYKAPVLKYVFGRSQYEDSFAHGNENIQAHIDFPALKFLSFRDVPDLVSIYTENYNLRGSSLTSVTLGWLPEFTVRPFNGFFVCWLTKQRETKTIEMRQQTLESLTVQDSKVEEIFDLTDMDIEKNGNGLEVLTSSLQELNLQCLSELVNLCVGPKHIICFRGLYLLEISTCKKLKVIFSTSIVSSLPMLKYLYISECEELVHIIEEDYETNVDEDLRHEPCFPNLKLVSVRDCEKLKYLFSITVSDILPKLRDLDIRKSNELEHVLIRRGEMKEMLMKDVLPQLKYLTLGELPNLVSICYGIDFQILKENSLAVVVDCPNFSFHETSATQLQTGLKTANSQVEKKAEGKLSSHLSTDQSLNMGEATQQSLIKDELVSKEEKNEAIIMDTSAIGAQNLKEKVPIYTSPNFIVLPTRGNSHASAKIFEDEEEEQADPFVPPITTISSEQPSEAILPLSAMPPKASTSLKETPSTLPKPFNDTTIPDGSKNQDSEVWEQTEQKLSSHSNGRQALETQQCTTGSSNFTAGTKEDAKEIVEEGIIFEKPKMTNLSSDSNVIGQSNDKEVNPSVTNRTDSQKAYSKDELVDKEVKKETIVMKPKSQEEMTRQDIQSHEEEEGEDGLITARRHQCDIKAEISLLKDKPKTVIHGNPNEPCLTPILSEQTSEAILPLSPISSKASTDLDQTPQARLGKTSDDGIYVSDNSHDIKESNVIQDESKANSSGHLSVDPSNLRQMEQGPSCSRGQLEHHDVLKSEINQALNVGGVQEIVEMMKLEGSETSLLAEALKTRPQLHLSTDDRSGQMVCISYRVLIDILNILTTRTPFTITEADKRFLEEKLKDACLLGFDKGWLQSIKTKVLNCNVYEFDGIQEILKGLESDLKTNEGMLAATRNQEVEAARVVELAQKELDAAFQEHANVMAIHSQLLKARQDIVARQNQYWEIISAQNKTFGF